MKLITNPIGSALLANGRAGEDAAMTGADHDPVPVVKFFTPAAQCTWLVTEMDPKEPDRLFGLADLGLGCPELGWFSLAEISQPVAAPMVIRGYASRSVPPMPLERDRHWDAKGTPLSVWTDIARANGRIIDQTPEMKDHNRAGQLF